MAGVKISALPAVASALLTDFLPVVQGGVTSKETLSQIATLFNSNLTFLPLAGGTMSGAIAMGTFKITGLGNPTLAQDAATKTYVDSAITSDAVLLNPSGNQTILLHNLTLAAGAFTIGSTSGGVNGEIILYPNSASAGGFRLFTNTVSSFSSTLSNSSIGQATTYSLPDPGAATTNLLLDKSATGKTINYQMTMPSIAFSSTSGIIGTTTNDSAASGSVGQLYSATTSFAAPVSLTTDTATDVASISLAAGDYDVWGNVGFLGGATTTVDYLVGWSSSTSATNPGRDSIIQFAYSPTSTIFNVANVIFNIQQRRVSLASPTTIYLSVQAGFGVSTCSAYGNIFARVRR